MQEQTTARQIETAINLWKPEISELILELVETCGDKEEVEKVRAWLNERGTIPTKAFTIAVTLVDFVIDDKHSTCKMIFGVIKNHIPFLPIIKTLIVRQVDDAEKERIAGMYLRELLKGATYKDNLHEAYSKWEEARGDTIQKLRDIADEMSNDRKNVNIAKVVGSSTSVLATATAVGVTVVAAIIPGGIALEGIIVGIGTAVGIAGGATNIGASVVADKLARKAEASSNAFLENQAKTTDDLLKLLDEYRKETKIHLETAKMFDDVVVRFKKINEDRVKVTIEIGDSVEEVLGFVKSVIKETELIEGKIKYIIKVVTIGGEVMTRVIGAAAVSKPALKVADRVLASSVQVLKTGARVAGVVAHAAVIGVDIYSIVKTSMELSDGSPDKAAINIREAAKELEERALPELKDLIIQTQLEAAEESEIPEVTD